MWSISTSLPVRSLTRWYRMRSAVPCSNWWNDTSCSWVAEYIATGTETSPNVIAPVQIGRATTPPPLTTRDPLPLGYPDARRRIAARPGPGRWTGRTQWTSPPVVVLRLVVLLEFGDLATGERELQGGDGVLEVVRLRRTHDRAGDHRLGQHPGQRHLSHRD